MACSLELSHLADTLDLDLVDEPLIEANLEILLASDQQRSAYSGYEPLSTSGRDIRLLKIWKSEDGEIHGQLRRASLLDGPDYDALSYCWGPPNRPKAIHISGEKVPITESLHSFLEALCQAGQQLPLWVDALCIDQSNINERGQQVTMMNQIFRRSNKVKAYIGAATPDTKYALDFLRLHRHPQLLKSEQYPTIKRRARESFFEILSRPYWQRVWIVQEMALAKELVLVFGEMTMEWSRFFLGANALLELPWNLVHALDRSSWADSKAIERYTEREQSLVYNILRLADARNDWNSATNIRSWSISRTVIDFGSNRCSEPKDKFYGFFSIAAPRLKVDYTKSLADIFFDILREENYKGANHHPTDSDYNWDTGVPFIFNWLNELGTNILRAITLSDHRTQLFKGLSDAEDDRLRSRLKDFDRFRHNQAQRRWDERREALKKPRGLVFWPVRDDDEPQDGDLPFLVGDDENPYPLVVVRKEGASLRCIGVVHERGTNIPWDVIWGLQDDEIQLCGAVKPIGEGDECQIFLHHSRVSVLASFCQESCSRKHIKEHRKIHALKDLCACNISFEDVMLGLSAFEQSVAQFRPTWTRRNLKNYDESDGSSIWDYNSDVQLPGIQSRSNSP